MSATRTSARASARRQAAAESAAAAAESTVTAAAPAEEPEPRVRKRSRPPISLSITIAPPTPPAVAGAEPGRRKRRAASASPVPAPGATPAQDSGQPAPLTPEHAAALKAWMNTVMTSLKGRTTKDGATTCELFLRLPTKSQYPDYYQAVPFPLDLRTVQQTIARGGYSSAIAFFNDLTLIFGNAKLYNAPGSEVYNNAKALQRVAKQLVSSRPPLEPASHEEVPPDSLAGVVKAVVAATAPGFPGRCVAEPFMKAPSKRYYAEYHRVVRFSMDLATVEQRLEAGMYRSLRDLAVDVDLVVSNAQTYNEDDSQIYEDATALKAAFRRATAAAAAAAVEDAELPRSGKRRRVGAAASKPGSAKATPPPSSSRQGQTKRKATTPTHALSPSAAEVQKVCQSTLYALALQTDEDGVSRCKVFEALPSRRDYPDYYKVIQEPLGLGTVRDRVRTGAYGTLDDFLRDIDTVFNNAQQYNQDGSEIFDAAKDLQTKAHGVVAAGRPKKRRRSAPKTSPQNAGGAAAAATTSPAASATSTPGAAPGTKAGTKSSPAGSASAAPPIVTRIKVTSLLQTTWRRIFDGLQNHALNVCKVAASDLLFKMPSRKADPWFYEVVTNPVDLNTVLQRIKEKVYPDNVAFLSDLVLVLTNSQMLHTPGTPEHTAAEALIKVLGSMARGALPRQDVLAVTALARQVAPVQSFAHQCLAELRKATDDGRDLCEPFMALPPPKDFEDYYALIQTPIAMNTLYDRINAAYYARLEQFQADVFTLFTNAREYNEKSSQLYADAVHLQKLFISTFTSLATKERITSKACDYTLDVFAKDLAEEEAKADSSSGEMNKHLKVGREVSSIRGDQGQTYSVGAFAYGPPAPGTVKPSIGHVQKLWYAADGTKLCRVQQFFRPENTFHPATRTFYEQEVLKTPLTADYKVSALRGTCVVMFIRDFLRHRPPKGTADEDLFLCERRYNPRLRSTQKIKLWPPEMATAAMVPRRVSLQQSEVPKLPSPLLRNKEDAADGADAAEVVVVDPAASDQAQDLLFPMSEVKGGKKAADKTKRYVLLRFAGVPFLLGDYVYLKSTEEGPWISRLEKIWTDANGEAWFEGTWFLRPDEVQAVPAGHKFYKRELVRGSRVQTSSFKSILCKCHVAMAGDFVKLRPLDVAEDDCYVCLSRYNEERHQLSKASSLGMASWPSNYPAIESLGLYPKLSLEAAASVVATETAAPIAPPRRGPGRPPGRRNTPKEGRKPTTLTVKLSGSPAQQGFAAFASHRGPQIRQQKPELSDEVINGAVHNEWMAMRESERKRWVTTARRAQKEPAIKMTLPRSSEQLSFAQPAARQAQNPPVILHIAAPPPPVTSVVDSTAFTARVGLQFSDAFMSFLRQGGAGSGASGADVTKQQDPPARPARPADLRSALQSLAHHLL